MASSKPCVELESRRVGRAPTTASTAAAVLPSDALYEILLWVPARELCRLRVVCRPWRSLLSGPRFIAAHAARHPEPLIVAGYHKGDRHHVFLFDIVDLSGAVVRRFRQTTTMADGESVTSTHRDLVGTNKGNGRGYRLLNPATGAVHALPEGLAEEHRPRHRGIREPKDMVVFTQVASTGEYKVLRIHFSFFSNHEQLFEVFTLGGGGGRSASHWRATVACPNRIDVTSKAVVNGVVYFFADDDGFLNLDGAPKRIVSFDFGTEEWGTTLRGPLIDHVGNVGNGVGMAELNGRLVAVHYVGSSSMDLWFLLDFEKSLWAKQHSIQVNLSVEHREFSIRPLLVLNDGRIVTYIGIRGLLRIYNPKTSTYTDVAEMGARVGVGLYTGNLLSLAA